MRTVLMVLAVAGLTACASPPEIKQASSAQVELTRSLDAAVVDLQAGLDRFHRAQETLIVEHARVALAEQAILLATEDDPERTVTADELDEIYETKIKGLLDVSIDPAGGLAASSQQLETEAKRLDRLAIKREADKQNLVTQLAGSTDQALEEQIEDLDVEILAIRDRARQTRRRAAAIRRTEQKLLGLLEAIRTDLDNTKTTRETVHASLAELRRHVRLMRYASEIVDAWLQQDVTVSPEQTAALQGVFMQGMTMLSGGDR